MIIERKDSLPSEDLPLEKALSGYECLRKAQGSSPTEKEILGLLRRVPKARRQETRKLMSLMERLYSLGKVAIPPEEVVAAAKEKGWKILLEETPELIGK